MKRLISHILLLAPLCCLGQGIGKNSLSRFQLASPKALVDSLIFVDSAGLSLHFGLPGAKIYYTTNGSEVDETALLYTKPVSFSKSTLIKAKSFHPDYSPSPTTEVQLIKAGINLKNARVKISPSPTPQYEGAGVASLHDGLKGGLQFRNGQRWLGFQSDRIEIELQFQQPRHFSQVVLSILTDQNSWIFPPERIEIKSANQIIGNLLANALVEGEKASLAYLVIPVKEETYSSLTISMYSQDEIPPWHPGKGTKPWTFIDEILIK